MPNQAPTFQCPRIFPNVHASSPMSTHLPQCPRIFPNVHASSPMSTHLPQCPRIFPNVHASSPMSSHLPQCPRIFPNVHASSPMSSHLPQCPRIFPNVHASSPMSTHLPQCPRIFPNVLASSPMSTHLPQCPRIFPNANTTYNFFYELLSLVAYLGSRKGEVKVEGKGVRPKGRPKGRSKTCAKRPGENIRDAYCGVQSHFAFELRCERSQRSHIPCKMISLSVVALVLCGATVALCSVANAPKHCSYEDAEIVMSEWYHVEGSGNSAPVLLRAANVLFNGLFDKDPSTRSLFARVNVADMHSGEFQAHTMRVMTGLDELIHKLHSPKVMDSMLEHLAEQHAVRTGVKREYFDIFRDILYDSLGQLLDEYNPDAWQNCLLKIFYGISGSLP
ncbi:Extracellular globin-2C [Lamellibrachia satsuma]|nr:Extracellular globin-2C [Lamellibrachia satsuma]